MSRFDSLQVQDYELPAALLARLQTPALVIQLDVVRENLRRMRAYLGGDLARWRPHAKTTKIAEVYAELVAVGVRAFKCATTREADVLLATMSAAGVSDGDVLLAYPVVGPTLERVAELARRYPATRVSILCENEAALDSLPANVGIFIDIDPGMGRTGMPASAHDTLLAIARAARGKFRGLHWYEGHLHGMRSEARAAQAFASYGQLLGCWRALQSGGIEVGEIVTSGTSTFRQALAFAPFASELGATRHRVSPGTVVFHDYRSELEIDDVDLVPAAVVATRVVSAPGERRVTCDAGSKSLAAEAGSPCAYVLGHPEFVPLTPSEEHLPIEVSRGNPPARGTVLYLVPRHICPTVNLAAEAVLVAAGRAVRIVPVGARAHELLLDPGRPLAMETRM
ncbi:MAG: alanine racemase [Planctomycetota bacterium]